MFNKDPSLRALRDRIKKDENPLNRYEADSTRFRTVKNDASNEYGRQSGTVFRAEMIYSSDLESVLSLLKRQSLEHQGTMPPESYEFYYACLDRIDVLITEKSSLATQKQIVQILRTLSYFRPKQQEYEKKSLKNQGYFTELDMSQDVISLRH